MGNIILFPAPYPTYTITSPPLLVKRIVWISENENYFKNNEKKKSSKRFPALWYYACSRHTLLYLHGNSADLGDVADELFLLYEFLNCNILAIEFPGYGICNSVSVDPNVIDQWARAAFNWLVNHDIQPISILPFGRSIGTGPAAKLAANLKQEGISCGGLILHSPYLSVHKIVSEYSSLGTWIIGNYWDTEESLKILASSGTPLLIIHGLNDEVISVAHGKKLLENYSVTESLKKGYFPEDCPHNAYIIIDHLGVPIKEFQSNVALSRIVKPVTRMQLFFKDITIPPEYKNAGQKTISPPEHEDTGGPWNIIRDEPSTITNASGVGLVIYVLF